MNTQLDNWEGVTELVNKLSCHEPGRFYSKSILFLSSLIVMIESISLIGKKPSSLSNLYKMSETQKLEFF